MNKDIEEIAIASGGTRKHVPGVWQFFDSELEEFAKRIISDYISDQTKNLEILSNQLTQPFNCHAKVLNVPNNSVICVQSHRETRELSDMYVSYIRGVLNSAFQSLPILIIGSDTDIYSVLGEDAALLKLTGAAQ